jgi:hypothetical protein
MSLLLNGSKTATMAGTLLQCIELYQGEKYTFPLEFKDSTGAAVNITGWTLTATAKWYTADITYPTTNTTVEDIVLSNLTLLSPQPSQPVGLAAAIVSGSLGTAYLYIPSTIDGGETIGIDANPSLMCIVTLGVQRTDSVSGQTDFNKEPLGFIIRYI